MAVSPAGLTLSVESHKDLYWDHCTLQRGLSAMAELLVSFSCNFPRQSKFEKSSAVICNIFVQVQLCIDDDPVADEDVVVDVEVIGVCQHVGDEMVVERPNRRQLWSDLRTEAADQLTMSQKSATEVYYARLSDMTQKEVSVGNTTACQTPAVLRQAAYERRRLEHLHENAVFELEIARESWEASTSGVHVSGYVQQLGIHLFYAE